MQTAIWTVKQVGDFSQCPGKQLLIYLISYCFRTIVHITKSIGPKEEAQASPITCHQARATKG